MSNKPVKTIRDGALKAAIWGNEVEKGRIYSVTLGRVYTDKNGNPQNADSFSATECLRLAHLLSKAYDAIGVLKQLDKSES